MKFTLVILLLASVTQFVLSKPRVKRDCCCESYECDYPCTTPCNNNRPCNSRPCDNRKQCNQKSCNDNNEEEDIKSLPVLVPFPQSNPPVQQVVPPTPSVVNNTNIYNNTVELTITNTINTVNNVSVPITVNSTNENIITVVLSPEKDDEVEIDEIHAETCCYITRERCFQNGTCKPEKNWECTSLCGDITDINYVNTTQLGNQTNNRQPQPQPHPLPPPFPIYPPLPYPSYPIYYEPRPIPQTPPFFELQPNPIRPIYQPQPIPNQPGNTNQGFQNIPQPIPNQGYGTFNPFQPIIYPGNPNQGFQNIPQQPVPNQGSGTSNPFQTIIYPGNPNQGFQNIPQQPIPNQGCGTSNPFQTIIYPGNPNQGFQNIPQQPTPNQGTGTSNPFQPIIQPGNSNQGTQNIPQQTPNQGCGPTIPFQPIIYPGNPSQGFQNVPQQPTPNQGYGSSIPFQQPIPERNNYFWINCSTPNGPIYLASETILPGQQQRFNSTPNQLTRSQLLQALGVTYQMPLQYHQYQPLNNSNQMQYIPYGYRQTVQYPGSNQSPQLRKFGGQPSQLFQYNGQYVLPQYTAKPVNQSLQPQQFIEQPTQQSVRYPGLQSQSNGQPLGGSLQYVQPQYIAKPQQYIQYNGQPNGLPQQTRYPYFSGTQNSQFYPQPLKQNVTKENDNL